MQTSSEYRRRAREALDGKIFGNTWLLMVLVSVVSSAILGATSVIPVIGLLILMGPVSMGVASYTLHVVRRTDKKNKIEPLLDGFHGSVATNILVGVLTGLFTVLWSLLFVIPGIVKAIAYSQVYYIALEHPEYDANQCITESRKMMNGHKWEYFCLQFSFIGWIIVGSLCFGIGTLWVSAYMSAANAAFYDDLKNQPLMQ